MNTENTPKTEERCPECGSALAFKSGKRGPFLACTAYPNCHYTKALHHGDGHVVKALGVACPECHHGELVLRQADLVCLSAAISFHNAPILKKRTSQITLR
ncbi:topoisomerase DNA-binding C4 zinc finger domain-containing protein [Salinivibrio socompensis]|uniref:DNA topoisomerase family protein n=1 Tax=Salinivibrio socompensis TaxID=1510206 RepID=UPI000FE14726